MPHTLLQVGARRALVADPAVPFTGPADALDLVGDSFAQDADVVVVHAAAMDPAVLELRTGLLGEVAQKLVNYHRTFVVLGDVQPWVDGSEAFAAFVRESNRGRHVWFVADEDELTARLDRA